MNTRLVLTKRVRERLAGMYKKTVTIQIRKPKAGTIFRKKTGPPTWLKYLVGTSVLVVAMSIFLIFPWSLILFVVLVTGTFTILVLAS